MLNEYFKELNEEYHNIMISQCLNKTKDEWTNADEATFLYKKGIFEKIIYLEKWFCCQFCLVDQNICDVFQSKLQCIS